MTSTPHSPNLGITLLRIALGTMWIAHALLKLFVFTLAGSAQFFTSVSHLGFLARTSLVLWLVRDGAWALRRSERFVPAAGAEA